ncbi:MAG: lactate utilization protein [Bacteroidetes bacterium]|nr:lactate utilization protein [Bacteroidota bacterium]
MIEIFDKSKFKEHKQLLEPDVRRKITQSNIRFLNAFENSKLQYSDLDLAKSKASRIKYSVLHELDKHLIEFETNFVQHGGKVVWTQNEEEAIQEILAIVERKKAKSIIKSNALILDEIHLDTHLKNYEVEVKETDLGYYAQANTKGNKSFHPTFSGLHFSKDDYTNLFHEKFKTSLNNTPTEILKSFRKQVRDENAKADIAISSANFLIADVGAISISENEGNQLLAAAFCKTQIIVIGIEKMLGSLKDLNLFISLYATHSYGQKLTAYNTILFGPSLENELDGPEEVIVVLVDNGRTNLLGKIEQRKALSCIDCGACYNVCPVYETIGGSSYGSSYAGPIGSIISPYLSDFSAHNHLSYTSSLCGRCTEICPVNININNLLLFNRNEAIIKKQTSVWERLLMKGWSYSMSNRGFVDKFSAKYKNWIIRRLIKKIWGEYSSIPIIKEKSFKQLWEEKNSLK